MFTPNHMLLKSMIRDLIKINNDRSEGYKKAANQSNKILQLNALFNYKAEQSKHFTNQLLALISNNETEDLTETTTAGKIFRVWMDIKNTFNSSDTISILESCEYIEFTTVKSYKKALNNCNEMGLEILEIILEQKNYISISESELTSLKGFSLKIS